MSKAYDIKDIKVGNDVEFFIQAPGDVLTPSWGLLGGTKDTPRAVEGGFVSEDGISAEVSTDPATSREEFIGNLATVKKSLEDLLDPMGLRLLTKASVVLTPDILEDKLSLVVGCDADHDPWGRRITTNPRPTYKDKSFRCSGGHVHVSHPILVHSEWRRVAAKLFDVYLGMPSVLIDKDANRRSMYGNAGAHRSTMYPDGSCGVEYRVLSNFWTESEELTGWVYDQTVRLVEDLIEREKTDNYSVPHEALIQYCITGGDIREAKSGMRHMPCEMPNA